MKRHWSYPCSYQDMTWDASIEILKNTPGMTRFIIRGRGSYIEGRLCVEEGQYWVGFPEAGKACSLSHPRDLFWNTEKLAEVWESVPDGVSMGEGIAQWYEFLGSSLEKEV